MTVILLMIPIALLLSASFVAAFVWASRTGQWDDLDLAPRKQLLETNPFLERYGAVVARTGEKNDNEQ